MTLFKSPKNLSNARIGQGFPKKLTVTHRWRQIFTLATAVAGARADYVMRCNGMQDPSVTGGAHQPLYFSQLSALYDQYTVIGSKCTLKIKKVDTSTQIPIQCNLMIGDDTTVTPAMLALMEHPSASNGHLGGYDQVLTLTKKWSAKQTFGGSVLGNDNLAGTATTNPAEESMFVFSIDSSINSTVTQVSVIAEIDYIAVWDELKDIANV